MAIQCSQSSGRFNTMDRHQVPKRE